MRIDTDLLNKLTEQAKASPRKRQHFDLRDSAEEPCMRMLNALEPETVIPIHRHRETSEEVVVLRGAVEEILYNDLGEEVERWRLKAGSECMACKVPMGMYHTCRSLQSGSVIMEFKQGRYDTATTEELLCKD